MFTGLVEQTGYIVERNISGKDGTLAVKPDTPFRELEFGESIAVNGTCLTLEKELSDGTVVFHVLAETLKATNLGEIPFSSKVNLERALPVGARLGGHIVSGHVDTTSEVIEVNPVGNDFEYKIKLPDSLKPYVVHKGSITIDGISLTVAELGDDYFCVHIIPVTLSETALSDRKAGDTVNLEGDIIGKYVVRQMELANYTKNSTVTMNSLIEAGW